VRRIVSKTEPCATLDETIPEEGHPMIRTFVRCVLALGAGSALVAAGCGSDRMDVVSGEGDGGTSLDGNLDGNALGDGTQNMDGASRGDGAICTGVGKSCVSPGECCSGGCGTTAVGQKQCLSIGGCKPAGQSCATARDCCSTACVNGQCSDTGGLCKTQGDACTAAVQCCSNVCNNTCQTLGGCRSGGDTCSSDGECCSKTCRQASDGKMRCQYNTYCRSEGEVCTQNDECCTGPCELDNAGTKRCKSSGICNVVGEACTGPAQCCSNACADNGSGFKICQYIGGCRPDKERCDTDKDCCTGTCKPDPQGGVKRCERTNDCGGVGGGAGPGEICDPSFHQCCPNPGEGALRCIETVFGVKRCLGATPAADGGFACVGDGGPCSFADECCGKKCIQQPDGSFKCQSACVPTSGKCTTNNDCCERNCDPITQTCKPAVSTCAPLGGPCQSAADCCSGLCGAGGTCYAIK
jgi:hypothetical protein